MLLFKKKFLEAIRDGRKTQTVRLWSRCRFRSGQRSYIPGVGPIRITAIDPILLEELNDEDAVLDGFESAAALLQEIRTLYADRLSHGYQAYRIRFERIVEEQKTSGLMPRSSENKPTVEPPQLRVHPVRPLRNASSRRTPE